MFADVVPEGASEEVGEFGATGVVVGDVGVGAGIDFIVATVSLGLPNSLLIVCWEVSESLGQRSSSCSLSSTKAWSPLASR